MGFFCCSFEEHLTLHSKVLFLLEVFVSCFLHVKNMLKLGLIKLKGMGISVLGMGSKALLKLGDIAV